MMIFSFPSKPVLLTCTFSLYAILCVKAQDAISFVLQNGKSIPVSSVNMQGDKLVVSKASEGFSPGQSISINMVDHIFGDKPVEINQGIVSLLMGKPAKALEILEPVMTSQRITAKIPGNYWLEAARVSLVAYAVSGNSEKCSEIGKIISDSTPTQGIDAFVSLGKALLLPSTTSIEERETSLRDLTTDNLPSDVNAYASFYRANLLNDVKRDKDPVKALAQSMEALEAYLMVSVLYPSGGMILNAVAEAKAAEFLVTLGRREEAVQLLQSSIRESNGTQVADEATKRLEELK